MKIERISIHALKMPLHKPYRLSGGRLLFTELDSTFIRIDTDNGLTGWGEACPWGHTYLPAHGPGIRAAGELLAPALIGMDPRQTEHVNRQMDVTLPGHLYAKAPFDIACWDILGKATGLAVVDLLGGRYHEPTPIASSISTDTPDAMLAEIDDYRARGYHVHSAKVGADVSRDIERIRHLASQERNGEFIFFDVNRAWTVMEALQVMNALRDLPHAVFEQPCETLDQCAQVRAKTIHPISIDERLETLSDMQRIIHEGTGEIVNIKLNRVGGLTRARRIRDLCLNAGINMLVMETGGSVVADTAVQHFAQSIPRDFRLGTWLCQEMIGPDTAPGKGSRNHEGTSAAPEAPGLGVEPDSNILGKPVAVYTKRP